MVLATLDRDNYWRGELGGMGGWAGIDLHAPKPN
jgi:hypothetical protein